MTLAQAIPFGRSGPRGPLLLQAELRLPAPEHCNGAAPYWRFNLAAIVETCDGGFSYWALHHPRAQPDFHDGDGFRLQLTGSA